MNTMTLKDKLDLIDDVDIRGLSSIGKLFLPTPITLSSSVFDCQYGLISRSPSRSSANRKPVILKTAHTDVCVIFAIAALIVASLSKILLGAAVWEVCSQQRTARSHRRRGVVVRRILECSGRACSESAAEPTVESLVYVFNSRDALE